MAVLKRTKPRTVRPKESVIQPGDFSEKRAKIVIGFFITFFMILSGRAVWLQIFPPSPRDLNQISSRQYNKEIKLSPYRGTIYDRRGEPLAMSIRKPSLFVNPRVFRPSRGEQQKLARILDLPLAQIQNISEKKNYFAWLKRKIDQKTYNSVMELKIDGLYHTSEPARFYPGQRSAANLLGYVNIDDKGMAGLEQQYNSILQGDPITLSSRKDARGQIIFHDSNEARPEKAGRNIKLTIDQAIQEIAMIALAKGVKEAKAKGGSVIVADPHTGRLLAVANVPTFEPNSRHISVKQTRNQALQDGFEPGSVMKTFVIAEALERGLIKPETELDCENGVYQAGGVTFRDSHRPETRFLSVTDIFKTSSNVCTYKIAEKLTPEVLYNSYQKLGFGAKLTSLNYPAQSFGYISHWQTWRPIRFANIAFGQGLLASPLEVVQALSAIANGGALMKPQLVDAIENDDGSWSHFTSQKIADVFTPATTQTMRKMMFDLVENGAKKARMSQYTAGGKTGTSQKIDPETKSYSKKDYWSIFGGIAPIHDPHLVVFVIIDEPDQKFRYGSLWAAPVFKEITEKSLHYLNVLPDKLHAQAETPKGSRIQ